MSEQEHKINEVGNTRDFVLPDPIKLPIIVLLPLKTRYSLKSQLVMSVCKVNLSLALCIPNISWWVSWFVPTIDRLEPATEACVIPYWLKLDKVGNLWHNSNHPVCIRLRKKKHISVLFFWLWVHPKQQKMSWCHIIGWAMYYCYTQEKLLRTRWIIVYMVCPEPLNQLVWNEKRENVINFTRQKKQFLTSTTRQKKVFRFWFLLLLLLVSFFLFQTLQYVCANTHTFD